MFFYFRANLPQLNKFIKIVFVLGVAGLAAGWFGTKASRPRPSLGVVSGTKLPVLAEADEVKLVSYPTEDALLTSFKLGEVSAILTENTTSLAKLSRWPNLGQKQQQEPTHLIVLLFNQKHPDLLNPEQRKTLSQTIRRGTLSPSLPAYSFLPSQHPDYQAQLALQETSAPTQPALPVDKLGVCYPKNENFDSVVNNLETQLKRLNVTVESRPLGKEGWPKELHERSCQTWLVELDLGPDYDFYPFFHSSQAREGGLNLGGFQDQQVDQALLTLKSKQSEEELQQSWQVLQERLLGNLPALPLYYHAYFLVYRQNAAETFAQWSDG